MGYLPKKKTGAGFLSPTRKQLSIEVGHQHWEAARKWWSPDAKKLSWVFLGRGRLGLDQRSMFRSVILMHFLGYQKIVTFLEVLDF